MWTGQIAAKPYLSGHIVRTMDTADDIRARRVAEEVSMLT
jgi:hypothetical protein